MFEKLNKQSAIAIAIVVILGIFAIAGTVIFLKDKGSTDAAEIASENSSNSETAEKSSEENNENNQANSSDSSDKNEQNQNNNTNNNNQGNNTSSNQQRQNENVGTNETTNEGANTNRVNTENRTTVDNTEVASSDIDTIQGSTITRVTEGDLVKVTDDRNVRWNQMDFEIQSASAKIDGEKSKITIEKKVTTKTGSNFTTQGEEIEYTLIATNNSDEDLKGIEVSDNIPEKTTYVENSASNDVNVIRENDTVVGLKWYVDISAGKSVELKFNVKVNEDAEGTISNLALTNGNTPSDEVKTAIITAEKNGTISRDGVILEKQPAKLNDIITYTINVENTGDIEGTTIVKDQKLGEILNSKIGEMYGDVIITDNNGQKEYSPEELINGIEINIKEKSKATVIFSIKVVKIDGKIINFATTGDNEEPTNEDGKDTYGFDVKKELTKIERDGKSINTKLPAKQGDILTYTISIHNAGSVDLNNLDVTDKLPEELSKQSATEFTNVSVKAGDTIELKVKARVENVNGTIVNKVLVEDKDENEDQKEDTETTETIGFTIKKDAKIIKAENNKNHLGYENIAEKGDIIKYSITVTNLGSTKLTGVKVEDNKTGVNINKTIDLEPNGIDGYTKTITQKYTVKSTDLELDELGKMKPIHNVATAMYEDSNGKIEKEDSVDVTVREDYDYTVEYYYDGVKDDSQTEIGSGKYLETINEYTPKDKDGYELNKTENLPLTITANSRGNVIKVYYTKRTDLSYKVNYLEKGTNKVLHDQKVQGGMTFESTVTSADEVIDIDGYNYDSVDKDTLTITTGENVINIYYTKRTDLSYKVNYLEKGTNKVLHNQKVQGGMTFESTVTSADEVITIDGYNYDSVDKDTLTITTGENVINIYYTKKTDLSYKVNYLEKGTNKVLHDQKVQGGMTFESTVTSTDEVITIDGYNYDSVDKDTLTITTGENVINIYYVKIDVTLTKTALLNGVEAKPLHQFKEGDIVEFKLTIKNNSRTHTVKNYIVTDTLSSELSYYGKQPEGTTVNGNELRWTIDEIRPGQTKTIIITTKVNYDQWSGNKYLHDISEVTVGTGTAMTRKEYNRGNQNEYEYDNNMKYYNCSFHVYNSQKGEIPYEDGTTQYDASNYSSVGFGRITGIQYDKTLKNVDDLNKVIDAHNSVQENIVYAPDYNPGKGKVVLWYVAKRISETDETINSTRAYVKYHVDGIVVDLNDIYSVKNEIVGSDGKTASDIILVKDDGNSKIASLANMIPENKVIYFENNKETNNETESAIAIENKNVEETKIEEVTKTCNDIPNESEIVENKEQEELKEKETENVPQEKEIEKIENSEETSDNEKNLENDDLVTEIKDEAKNQIFEENLNENSTIQNLQE